MTRVKLLNTELAKSGDSLESEDTVSDTSEVRLVIPDEGSTVVTYEEAVRISQERGEELIRIADGSDTQPPVYKSFNRGFEEYLSKKHSNGQKHHKPKEVEFSASIAEADFDRKVRQVEKFLGRGLKVQARVLMSRDRSGLAQAERVAEFIT